jgi:cytochrome c5
MSSGALRHSRRRGIVGLAIVLISAQSVVSWGSNESTGKDFTNPPPVVDQTDNTDVHEDEQPVNPAASPSVKENSLAETDTDQALGEKVFNHTCLTCHGSSVSNAPRVGDMHVWQPRLVQGLDILIQHAQEGHGRMPAKGGYSTLTDLEVSSAVAYVYQSGMEILTNQDNTMTHKGCDMVSNLNQCSPEEMKKLLILQMLWLLLGGGQQQ